MKRYVVYNIHNHADNSIGMTAEAAVRELLTFGGNDYRIVHEAEVYRLHVKVGPMLDFAPTSFSAKTVNALNEAILKEAWGDRRAVEEKTFDVMRQPNDIARLSSQIIYLIDLIEGVKTDLTMILLRGPDGTGLEKGAKVN